jgi:hypothetical protein
MRILLACFLLAAGDAAAKTCIIESKTPEALHLVVQAKGGPELHVRVANVPVAMKITDPGWAAPPAVISVDVKGPLAFSATIAPEKIPLKPKKQIDSSNGMLRLRPGAGQFAAKVARNKFVEGDLLLDGVHFKGVNLPCEVLSLDPVESPAVHQEPPHAEPVVAKASPLKLWADAGGKGDAMEVVMASPLDLELQRYEKSGAYQKVGVKFRDGSRLSAWAKSDDLTAPGRHELQDMPIIPPACARTPEAKGGLKLASASINPGTAISADRLFQWATARGGDSLTVRYKEGESWVEIVGVPGITAPSECEGSMVLDEAWVPRSAVKFPGAAPDGGVK